MINLGPLAFHTGKLPGPQWLLSTRVSLYRLGWRLYRRRAGLSRAALLNLYSRLPAKPK